MPIIAKGASRDFPVAPQGLHQAICVDVVDLGLVETKWGMKPKVRIVWQLDENQPDGRRFEVASTYTLSLSDKAILRHHLEAWRGKRFTDAELAGFDLEKLIGVNCQVQIVHNIADGGRTYANVQAVVPLGKTMPRIAAENFVRYQDRPKQQGTGNGQVAASEEGEVEDDSGIPF